MSFFSRRTRYKEVEIDDAVLTITEKDAARIESPINRRGVFWFRIFFVFILVMLGSRIFFLNIIRGSYYCDMAARNSVRNVLLPAPRGLIFDRYGEQLVHNIPSMELVIIPSGLPEREDEVRAMKEKIQSFLSIDSDFLEEVFSFASENSTSPVVLKSAITQEEALIFSSRILEFPGIVLERSAIREYVDSSIFSHILGYEGKIKKEELETHPEYLSVDSIGKQGVEKSYETILRGKRGVDRVEVDSLGNTKKNLGALLPESGNDIVLNIDADLQKKIFDSMRSTLENQKLEKGVAIAIDPRDGGVLALVSLPSFDNNLFAKGIDQASYSSLIDDESLPLFDRAIAGEYPPGSTIKPFVACAALSEKIVSANMEIESRGGISVAGFSFGDWKAHGFTDIRRAIAVSSDVYFYSVGGGYGNIRGLGMEKMKSYEELFGFGSKTGIDLPGEKEGFLPSPEWKKEKMGERWYIGDTYHAAIGQGFVLATPLQIVNATAAIANGGTLWTPRIAGQIRYQNGTTKAIPPVAIREHIVDPSILAIIRDGMRMTVTSGTAQSLSSLPVAVSGKTGTAQFGSENKTHGWFSSFAPSDHPTIVMIVLIEGQEENEYGAVPVTKDIYSWYFSEGRGKEEK